MDAKPSISPERDKWEYSACQTEVSKMNTMGSYGYEAFGISPNGWTYFKRKI